jgi:hypothetical protein
MTNEVQCHCTNVTFDDVENQIKLVSTILIITKHPGTIGQVTTNDTDM